MLSREHGGVLRHLTSITIVLLLCFSLVALGVPSAALADESSSTSTDSTTDSSDTDSSADNDTSTGTSSDETGGSSASGSSSKSSSGSSSTTPKLKLAKAKIKSVSGYEKHVTLKWKKVAKAKKYYVYRSTKKSSGYKKIATTTKRTYTDKKAKKRTTYYYKVQATAKNAAGTWKTGKKSAAKKFYVHPANPKTVICGECFAVGLRTVCGHSSYYKFVAKTGISTYGILNSNYFSYGGRTVTALERVAYYNPDRVYFISGMNEAWSYSSSARTVANYKKMIKLLKRANPNIEVVIMALPPVNGKYARIKSRLIRWNKQLQAMCAAQKNVYFYSSYRSILTNSSGYLTSAYNGGDGLHWSYSGYSKVMAALKKWNKKLTKQGAAITS